MPLKIHNPNHQPAGSATGGQFAPRMHALPDDEGNAVLITRPTASTNAASWYDAHAIATLGHGDKTPVADTNGQSFKYWGGPPDGDWTRYADKPGLDKQPLVAGPRVRAAAGVIIEEPDGRVWLMAPTNQFGDYAATFPKGGREKGLTLQQTAIKEAYEETGLHVEITGVVGDFERSTSVCRYYTAKRVGGKPSAMGWEAQAMHLVPKSKLKHLLNHRNDHAVVDAFTKPSLEKSMPLKLDLKKGRCKKCGKKLCKCLNKAKPDWVNNNKPKIIKAAMTKSTLNGQTIEVISLFKAVKFKTADDHDDHHMNAIGNHMTKMGAKNISSMGNKVEGHFKSPAHAAKFTSAVQAKGYTAKHLSGGTSRGVHVTIPKMQKSVSGADMKTIQGLKPPSGARKTGGIKIDRSKVPAAMTSALTTMKKNLKHPSRNRAMGAAEKHHRARVSMSKSEGATMQKSDGAWSTRGANHTMKTPHGSYTVKPHPDGGHKVIYNPKTPEPGSFHGPKNISEGSPLKTPEHAKAYAVKHSGLVTAQKSLNNEDTNMSTDFDDLFKSELGESPDAPIIDCPHCEHPITKSEVLAKANGKDFVKPDNEGGKTHRGPAAGPMNKKTPTRSAKGVSKITHTKNTTKVEKSDGDDGSVQEPELESEEVDDSPVAPSQQRTGAENLVQFVNTGEDERVAKLIEAGLGQGGIIRQPIDKNKAVNR